MAIYRSALINRRDGMTAEQFKRHWIEVHGYLASKMPGLGSYLQNHVAERFYDALQPRVQSVDGMSHLAFADIAAMETSERSAEYAQVRDDIKNFQGGITILVLEPQIIYPQPAKSHETHHKLLWISSYRDEPLDDVQRDEWMQTSRQLAGEVQGLDGFIHNFVVDRAHPVMAGVPAGDANAVEAVTEMWFSSAQALESAVESATCAKIFQSSPIVEPLAIFRIDEVRIV